jgi:Nucleotidyltransferase domain.
MLQLRPADRHTLQAAFTQFPEVLRVWVFGSRASGQARRASDIDLAIEAPALTDRRWHALTDALEHLPIIYKLDLVRLDTLQDPALKRAIEHTRTPL